MLVEQVIALTLIVVSMLALLTVLGAGTTAVVNGRQRTVATSLGRQVLERMQGGAYTSVAMNLSDPELLADPRVDALATPLKFELEQLVGGSSAPFQATEEVAGASYTISTFVTAVTPTQGLPYRRLTVFVDWTPSLSGNFHTQRFSTLVYPLDYSSYPAGGGLAEVTGGRITVTGNLGGDVFEDVQMALPGARAKTSASTLRTAHGLASSSNAVLDLAAGPLTAPLCTVTGLSGDIVNCPVVTVNEAADNDSTTSAATWTANGTSLLFGGAAVTTPRGLLWSLPSGSGTAHAAVEKCGCSYGVLHDDDGLPWADGTRQTSSSAQASFAPGGGLSGRLWEMGTGWSATTSVDHDATGGGRVTSTAQVMAPAVKVFAVDGGPTEDPTIAGAGDPEVFAGAVLVGTSSGFTAKATAEAGYGSVGLPFVTGSVPVKLWHKDDQGRAAYRDVTVTPGDATDQTASASFVAGDHTVSFTSRVQSAPNTSTSTGVMPRTEADTQQPSLLLVTVDVVITGPHPGAFTITVDYGQVRARSAWTVAP